VSQTHDCSTWSDDAALDDVRRRGGDEGALRRDGILMSPNRLEWLIRHARRRRMFGIIEWGLSVRDT